MYFHLKAASLALQSFPVLNASVDEKLENITYKVSKVNCSEKFSLVIADLYLFSDVNGVKGPCAELLDSIPH